MHAQCLVLCAGSRAIRQCCCACQVALDDEEVARVQQLLKASETRRKERAGAIAAALRGTGAL